MTKYHREYIFNRNCNIQVPFLDYLNVCLTGGKGNILETWRQTSKANGARCSSMVRAFAHGAMGRRIDPSWSVPIELFLVPASVPQLV